METKPLKLYKDGFFIEAQLIYEEEESPYVQLSSTVYNSGRIEGEILFYCMQELHEILDSLGLKLLCNGFRKDVYPSNMALSMGHGIHAYKMVMGVPAKDLVNIFDETDRLDLIGTCEEQKEYYRNWIKSFDVNRT